MPDLLLRFLFTSLMLSLTGLARAQYVDTTLLVPNSAISGYAENDSLLFMYGSFSSFAAKDPYGVIIDTATGATFQHPNPDDQVDVAISDGQGGWFVGGEFLSYGGVSRDHLAHIDSNGNVTAFNVIVNGSVAALLLSGDTLYVGGTFTQLNGQPRNNAGSIIVSTASHTNWDPNVTGSVNAFALKQDSVYIGGSFSAVDGFPRDNICVVDADTGGLGPWNPELNNRVTCLLAAGPRLYIGGSFTTIDIFTQRGRGAAYNMNTYTLLNWNPNADGHIEDIEEYNGRLFICGSFNNLASNPHKSFAEVDISTGIVLSAVEGDGIITAEEMVITNDKAYIVGVMNIVNNVVRHDAVAINVNSGVIESWAPEPGWQVLTIAISGGRFYLGGIFQGIHSETRINLAALNKQTGQLIPWAPQISSVNCLLVVDSILYVGGTFTSVDGIFRNRLAAFSLNTFTVTSWNPDANDAVYAMIYSDSVIYVAGEFTILGGQSRSKAGGIRFGTDSVTSWQPPVIIGTPRINSIAKIDSILYVAGTFQFVGGNPRNRLAAYHVGHNDSVTSWSPNANNSVTTIYALGNRLVVKGNFSVLNSLPVQKFAVLDTTFGNFSPGFSTQFDNSVGLFHVNGGRMLVTGAFLNYGTTPAERFAMISAFNGTLLPYHLNVNTTTSVYETGGWIYLSGGSLRTINQTPVWNFARVSSSEYMEVTGNIWMDADGDGVRDTNEFPAVYYPVSVSSNSYTAYTDADGNYIAYCDSGQYVVSPVPTQYVVASIPASHSVNVSPASPHDSLNDFGLIQIPGIRDLSIYLTPVGLARANTPRFYRVTAVNNGSTTENPLIKMSDDAVQTFSYGNPNEDSVSFDSTYYSFVSLAPTQHLPIDLAYMLPICPVGTPLWLAGEIKPVLGDTVPTDNYDTLNTTVVASYDPNYKEVFPSELYVPLSTTALEYIIHFQNTGNDTAINIVLTDSLSPLLIASSLQFISSSHPSTFHTNGQLLTIEFDSIMLPDSSTNATLSEGYFHFKINVIPGMVSNSVVNNTAYIYFDYNAPVITNSTTTIFLQSVITQQEEPPSDHSIKVFPVPANGNVTIELPAHIVLPAIITVSNIFGDVIITKLSSGHQTDLNFEGVPQGVYMIRVTQPNSEIELTKKIIVIGE